MLFRFRAATCLAVLSVSYTLMGPFHLAGQADEDWTYLVELENTWLESGESPAFTLPKKGRWEMSPELLLRGPFDDRGRAMMWPTKERPPFVGDLRSTRWTDSLNGYVPILFGGVITGRREWYAVEDTVWDGRSARILKDTAVVSVSASRARRRHFSGDTVRSIRTATGTIVGRTVIDAVDGTLYERTEAGDISGVTVMMDSSGDTIAMGPARLSHRRSYSRVRVSEARAAIAEDRAEAMARLRLTTGPDVELFPRIRQQGDTVAQLEAIRRWAMSRDPVRRGMLFQGIRVGGAMPSRELDMLNLALEAGDTARVVDLAWTGDYGRPRQFTNPDSVFLAHYLPLLKSADRALRFGLVQDQLYGNVHGYLMSGIGSGEDGRFPCSVLCELLKAEDAAKDRRLRGIALIAKYLDDPRTYWDELRAEAAAPDAPLHVVQAYRLTLGVPGGHSENRPVPSISAPVEDWLEWTSAPWVNQDYYRAIALYKQRTGRDPLLGLTAAYRSATTEIQRDSLAGVLTRFKWSLEPGTTEQIADDFRSGSERRMGLADHALMTRRNRRYPTNKPNPREVDASIQASRYVRGGGVAWTGLRPGSEGEGLLGGVRATAALSLTQPLSAKFEADTTVRWIARKEFQLIDPLSGGVFVRVSSNESSHPFYLIQVDWLARARATGDSLSGRVRLVLLATEDAGEEGFELLAAESEGDAPTLLELRDATVQLPELLRHFQVTGTMREVFGDRPSRWSSRASTGITLSVDSVRASPTSSFPRVTISAGCCGQNWTVSEKLGRWQLALPPPRSANRPRDRDGAGALHGLGALYPGRWTWAGPRALRPWIEYLVYAAPMLSSLNGAGEAIPQVDTVDYAARADANSVVYQGVRHSSLLETEIVSDRQVWHVRDSTVIRQDLSWTAFDVYLGDSIRYRRRLEGTSNGLLRYDPDRGIALSRSDTIQLKGWHLRELPTGRVDSTRIRVDRAQAMRLLTTAERDAESVARGGVRIAPNPPPFFVVADTAAFNSTPLGQLGMGDSIPLREVLAIWASGPLARPPDGIHMAIQRVYGTVPWTRRNALLETAHWDADNPIAALELTSYQSTRASVERALDVLDDPARVVELGIDFERTMDRLAASLQPPWYSIPHDELADQFEAWEPFESRLMTLSDPRLQDLALFVSVLRDPALWYESAVARATQGSLLAETGKRLAEGHTAWPGQQGMLISGDVNLSRPSMAAPAPDAPAGEWKLWGDAANLRQSQIPGSIHVYGRRVGWRPFEGFLQRYKVAETSEDRAIWARFLLSMDREFITAAEAARWLLGGGPLSEVARMWMGWFGGTNEDMGPLVPVFEQVVEEIRTRGAIWADEAPIESLLDSDGSIRPIRIQLPPWVERAKWLPPPGLEIVGNEDLYYTDRGYEGLTIPAASGVRRGSIYKLTMTLLVGPLNGVGYHGPNAWAEEHVQLLFVHTTDGWVRIPN
jgi:hypothetical protein